MPYEEIHSPEEKEITDKLGDLGLNYSTPFKTEERLQDSFQGNEGTRERG